MAAASPARTSRSVVSAGSEVRAAASSSIARASAGRPRTTAMAARTDRMRVRRASSSARASAWSARAWASGARPACQADSAAATRRRAREASSVEQLRRPLQRRRGGGVAAARAGALGGALELGGDLLVGAEVRRGPVPGAAIGVALAAQHLGEGRMRRAAQRERQAPVQRRAGHRMAHLDAVPRDPHQPGSLRHLDVGRLGAQERGGGGHHPQLARVLGGRHRQHRPRGVAQIARAIDECVLQAAGQGKVIGQGLVARELAGREQLRHLDQRERVAPGHRDQPLGDVRRHAASHPLLQHRTRRRAVEPSEAPFGDAGALEAARLALARGDQQRDRLGHEPPGDEAERLRRGPVEPLGVVHHHQQRPLVGGVGQQAESPERDQEAVVNAVGRQPERAAQRGGLRGGEVVDAIEARREHLVEAGEGQLRLRLHADRPEHRHAGGGGGDVGQQRGLADTALPAHHQRPTARAPRPVEHRRDRRALLLAADDHGHGGELLGVGAIARRGIA